jgi:hypothetical protein
MLMHAAGAAVGAGMPTSKRRKISEFEVFDETARDASASSSSSWASAEPYAMDDAALFFSDASRDSVVTVVSEESSFDETAASSFPSSPSPYDTLDDASQLDDDCASQTPPAPEQRLSLPERPAFHCVPATVPPANVAHPLRCPDLGVFQVPLPPGHRWSQAVVGAALACVRGTRLAEALYYCRHVPVKLPSLSPSSSSSSTCEYVPWQVHLPLVDTWCIVCRVKSRKGVVSPVHKVGPLRLSDINPVECSRLNLPERPVVHMANVVYWLHKRIAAGTLDDLVGTPFMPSKASLSARRRPVRASCVEGCINPLHYEE